MAEAPFCALLLDSTRDEGEEFLVYSYPRDTEASKSLLPLKGVFLASNGIVNAVIGQNVRLISLKSVHSAEKKDSDTDIKVSISPIEKWVIALVFPSSIPDLLATSAVEESINYFQLLYPSLSSVILGDDSRPPSALCANLAHLIEQFDPIFHSIYERLVPLAIPGHPFSPVLSPLISSIFDHGICSFPLSTEQRIELSELFTSFFSTAPNTSSPFGFRPDIACIDPLACLPVASCLFLRGMLVYNELNSAELRNIARFCQLYDLLSRPTGSPQIAVSAELYFPLRPSDHIEKGSRVKRVLSIVGRGDVLICLLCSIRGPVSGQYDPYHLDKLLQLFEDLQAKRTVSALNQQMNEFFKERYKEGTPQPVKPIRKISSNSFFRSESKRLVPGIMNALERKPSFSTQSPVSIRSPSPTPSVSEKRTGSASAVQSIPPSTISTLYDTHVIYTVIFHTAHTSIILPVEKASLELLGDMYEHFLRNFTSIHHKMKRYSRIKSANERLHRNEESVQDRVHNEPGFFPLLVESTQEDKAQKLGTADSSVYERHRPVEPLGQISEMNLKVKLNVPIMSNEVVYESFWIAGRIVSQQEVYICYVDALPKPAADIAFHMTFGLPTI
eukprot:GILK01010103.1.p1 GENE.GILK01010103.1~~GILK01010103.1.p1  ORF type:complete len:631 (-),score=84.35 GILK01010103.1:4-1851(-)